MEKNMKKFLICGILGAGAMFASCSYTEMIDEPSTPGNPGKSYLQVTIDDIDTTVETRSLVTAEPGETDAAGLHLFFFDYSTDGSGAFVHDYQVPNGSLLTDGTPFELKIGTAPGVGLTHTDNYSILAYANIDASVFASVTSGMTENAVKAILLTNPAGGFPQTALPMSGATVKMKDQELVELKLTRMVSRFDVQNSLSDYDLVSVSIWHAAEKSTVWGNANISGQTHTERFCGVGNGSTAMTGVTGGLYAFENFVGNPVGNPDQTTALVIGLKQGAGSVQYYRIDVHPQDAAQNLQRNYVYKVTVRGVTGAGEATEQAAIDDTKNPLDYTINNWSLDDEGLVLTDGTNTMAVPSKYIKFGPEAETRKYVVYTLGTGTLEITKRNLPNGITASLSGNTLTVSATALPGDDERGGTFELGFAGLLGTIEVIQSPEDDNYLFLDKSTLPIFDAGLSAIPQSVTVSSSGAWTAKIYNTSESANPGFTFSSSGASGPADLIASGNPGETLDIYTTGANPGNNVRQGFVLVSLDADPKYRQVLVITQDAKGMIKISPSYSALPFDAVGNATGLHGSTSQTYYQINVSPGKTNADVLRDWDAELQGAASGYFKLTKIGGNNPYMVLSPLGNNALYPGFNLTGDVLENLTLRIWLTEFGNNTAGAPDTYIELPVTQEKLEFTVTRVSTLQTVPVTGTKVDGTYRSYVEYKVNLPAVLQWEAEITDQSLPESNTRTYRRHEGYLINSNGTKVDGTNISAQSTSNTLRVGFDKIYYPTVHWEEAAVSSDYYNLPEVTIRVSVSGVGVLGSKTITVQQDPLVARAVKSQTSLTGWGSMGYNTGTGVNSYVQRLHNYVTSSYLFGTTPGTGSMEIVRDDYSTATSYIGTRNAVEANVNWVQVTTDNSNTSANLTRIYNWWKSNDHHTLVTAMDDWSNSQALMPAFSLNNDYTLANSTSPYTGYFSQDSYNNGRRVMLYLMKDGPATKGAEIPNWKTASMSGNSTSTKLTRWPATAVPVIQFGSSGSPATSAMSVVIDPALNFIYMGEVDHIYTEPNPATPASKPGVSGSWNAEGYYLANLAAYIMNSSAYGSHFTELFIDSNAEMNAQYEKAKEYWSTR